MVRTTWQKDRDEDNEDRASRVEQALSAYCTARGGNDDEADFRDLLADMMHYANVNDLNFNKELKTARMNYNAET
jgi:hypothetical protein